ncbi:cell division protein FtsA, partial [Anoxybacillus sp. LAT_38]|nr:cell division protein FtsA [Anoxybacillus sp. LAT_38]
SLGPIALVNGVRQPLDAPLADRSEVEIRLPRTVEEVLREAGLLPDGDEEATPPLRFSVNGRSYTLPARILRVEVNGKPAALDDRVRPG